MLTLGPQMRVLDENWKKAEDEVYRLDELVENIKQVSEGVVSSGLLLLCRDWMNSWRTNR